MDKVLVEVHCAAVSKSYDFWIPKKMRISKVIEKMVSDISQHELNNELFNYERQIFMYFYEQRIFLNPDQTVEEAGIVSGTRLMII
ncbi:MAG: hypothetical protein RR746_05720 [Lachnospiraceae bacterium]